MESGHTPASPQIPRVWPFKRVYYGWAIVLASVLAGIGQVPMFGPVLSVFVHPLEQDLGWSRASISLGFTIGTMLGAALSFAIGSLLDRYGARGLVVISGIVAGASMLGLGVMSQPWHLWALLGIGRGAVLAGVQMGTTVAISNWFVRKRGRTLAIRGSALRAAQAVFPVLIVAIIAASSWRVAFVSLAGATALLTVVPAALLMRRRPEDMGLLPDGAHAREQAPLSPSSRPLPSPDPEGEESWTLAEARATRSLWLLSIVYMGAPFAMGSVNLHMMANFEDKGLTAGMAVSVVSIFAATSAVMVILWGLVLERVHVRHGAMLMSAALALSMGIALMANTYPLAVLFGVVFGVGQGGWTIIQGLLLAEYFGRRWHGTIRGFVSPFRMVAPVGPVAAGWIRDATGTYNLAFVVFGAVFALMFLLMFLATPPRRAGPGRPRPGAL